MNSPSGVLGKRPDLWQRLAAHLSIARLDHSIKNVFIVPGVLIPITLLHYCPPWLWRNLIIGFASTTLIACSNYVINELLDAPYDQLHPIKKNRPAARGLINVPVAYAQWILMMLIGMALALQISLQFAYAAAALWVMGCLYNIPPFRTKDVVYLDVLSESVNNPIRMLLGWYIVASTITPPISLLVCYWMIGAYLMGLKRFSEYREIGERARAGAYRKSFRSYSEQSLLRSVIFYASFAMLLFGAFIMRYRIELILSFPFVALVMCTYFDMAFAPQSSVQNPEKLYREPVLMGEVLITTVAIVALLYVDLPWLGKMFVSSIPPGR